MYWSDGGWHMGWMAIWWLLVPLMLAAAGWTVMRGGRGTNKAPESPEHILKRRYASGELDRDAYLRMLSDLKDK
jgi:putative membrane protein